MKRFFTCMWVICLLSIMFMYPSVYAGVIQIDSIGELQKIDNTAVNSLNGKYKFTKGIDVSLVVDKGEGEGEGEGMSEVIPIASIEELQKIGNDEAYPLDGEYELTQDIDASDTINWNNGAGFKPIGTSIAPFIGKIDGKEYKITGLYINRSGENYIGLFGFIGSGGEVRNLGIETCIIIGKNSVGSFVGINYGNITSSSSTGTVSGSEDVGGFAGKNYSDITSSSSTGTVSGSKNTGGFVGSNEGSITNSYNTGDVSGNEDVGGFVGKNYDSIVSSYSAGTVLGNKNVGGLIGENGYCDSSQICHGSIADSYSTSAVWGSENVGGLVGYINGDNITHSYSTGAVWGKNNVGGLVGYNNVGSIVKTYSTSPVWGDENSVGGLVGLNGYKGSITDSFSAGAVCGSEYVGGLVGKNMLIITNSYSIGTVWGSKNVGGLVGLNTGNITNSYWDIETSNQTSSAGGEGKTTEQMKQQTTYIGWDFVSVWVIEIEEGEGEEEDKVSYPYFIELGPTQFSISPLIETKEINTLEELSKVGIDPEYPWWWNYELTEDIDASETINWNSGKGFNPLRLVGEFNGNTHEIASLYINRPDENNIGLFGILGPGGQVRDIGLDDCSVVGNNTVGSLVGWNKGSIISSYNTGTVSGNGDVGGLIGINENSITNSYSTGKVSGTGNYVGGLVGENKNGGAITNSYSTGMVSGNNRHVGGLVGRNEGSITNNYSKGEVSGIGYIGGLAGSNGGGIESSYSRGAVYGNLYIGGLVGWNYEGYITNSYNTGAVSGSGENIGGLVGYNNGSSITNSYSTGAVSGGGNYVGGLVGYNNGGSITRSSYSKGTVQGNGNYVGGLIGWNYGDITLSYNLGKVIGISYVGGLIGNNNGTINSSYNMGAVFATLDYAGGLVGYNENSGNIILSYNLGAVSGRKDVGGITGLNRGSITYNYSTGAVSATGTYVGGLVGENYGSVTSSYWDIETSGQANSAGGGEGKTTTKLKQQATYAGWDFNIAWNILEGVSYPFLKGIVYKPEITILGETDLIIECKTVYEDAGATAYDIPDGDLTDKIEITNNVNSEIVGDYTVEYVVTDSDGNISIETRLVYVVDTVGPEITLNGDNPMTLECNTNFTDPGATAIDNCDGLEATVQTISNNINPSRSGIYQVVYRAVDSSENSTEITREVRVECPGEGLVEGTTEGTAEGVHEGITEGTTEGTAEGTVEGITEGTTEGVHEGITEGTTEGTSEGTVEGITEGTAEGVHEGITEGITEGTSEGTVEGITEGTAEGVHEGITEGTTEGTSEGTVEGITEGTAEGEVISDVIKIDNIEELQKIGNDPAYPLNGKYELTQDIDASDTINWNNGAGFKPIGTSNAQFLGKIDGNGHKITGLYINRFEEDYIGLFGYIGSGEEMKNLGLEDCWVVGNENVGSLVGYNGGSITSSYSTGAVCGDDDVGGLVGYNGGSITSSYSTGAVCGDDYVGSLVGYNGGSITSSYSTGAVCGDDDVGGLVGFNYYGSITSSYSTGAVSGSSRVGGLVGYNSDSIVSSYSTGVVSGNSGVGGLVGFNYGRITSSYWDVETSGQSSSAGGVGKTTVEMKQQATYVGWDFVNVWMIEEGVNYPYLRELGPTQVSTPPVVETKEINSLEELSKIGYYPDYPWWWNYELMVDIDASETINWDGGKGFKPLRLFGKFDGNGHVIRNLYINRSNEDYIGLIGILGVGGEVKNLGLEDCWIIGSYSVGGLVGYNGHDGSIMSSYSTGAVSGSSRVGGLVGENWGSITSSYSTGAVSGISQVGGLVGENRYGSITSSYSTGAVSASWNVGGLVGLNDGSIMSSYSIGVVSGSSGVGGLVGYNEGSILSSYSIGAASGVGNVGGLVGENWGSITSSYWDIETSGQSSSDGGEGKTTMEMKQQATYSEWDFKNTWGIVENSSYPYLLWQGGPLVTCPDVVGISRSLAESKITGAGFKIGNVIMECSNTIPAGNVISQNPSAGQYVNPGMKLDLIVSSGPCPEREGLEEGLTEGEGNDEGTNDGVHEGITEGTSDGIHEGEGQGGGDGGGGGCGCSGGKGMLSFDGFMKYLLDFLFVGFLVSLMSGMKRQNRYD